jgi:hypothetical protein
MRRPKTQATEGDSFEPVRVARVLATPDALERVDQRNPEMTRVEFNPEYWKAWRALSVSEKHATFLLTVEQFRYLNGQKYLRLAEALRTRSVRRHFEDLGLPGGKSAVAAERRRALLYLVASVIRAHCQPDTPAEPGPSTEELDRTIEDAFRGLTSRRELGARLASFSEAEKINARIALGEIERHAGTGGRRTGSDFKMSFFRALVERGGLTPKQVARLGAALFRWKARSDGDDRIENLRDAIQKRISDAPTRARRSQESRSVFLTGGKRPIKGRSKRWSRDGSR